MLKHTMKSAVVLTTSAIAIPYAVAILAHMMYGWPQGKDRYKKVLKALHPKKVYAISYAVLQELAMVRYSVLCMQWNIFYRQSEPDRLIKDLSYGNNGNALDLYFPHDINGGAVPGNKPIVVFVYGGSWGSGDKCQYGLLCCQVADKLKAIVCCPNYSIYPKGYVDDMVQDIVDCIAWIQDRIPEYGGDKSKIVLLGHSAGAHLCVMSILELTIKKLMHHPEAVLFSLTDPPVGSASRQASSMFSSNSRQTSSLFTDSFRFEDKHFNGSNASNVSNASSGSFVVVDEKDKGEHVQDHGVELDDKSEPRVSSDDEKKDGNSEDDETTLIEPSELGGETVGEGEEVLQVEVTEVTSGADIPHIDIDAELTQSQRDARDILSSVKLVIGLAGVYHIADHYKHETWRGIEFASCMSRAMYGPDHFDRLSPCLLVEELPDKIKLPPILLLHGDKDKTVPLSSSLRLSQALWDKSCHEVSVTMLPGCPHIDICVDLMDPRRRWYDTVMEEIMKASQKYL